MPTTNDSAEIRSIVGAFTALPLWWIGGGALLIEVLSFIVVQHPTWSSIITLLLTGLVGAFSIKNLKYGIFAQTLELLVASKGYLFAMTVGGLTLPLRITVFTIVFAAALYHAWQQRSTVRALFAREEVWRGILLIVLVASGAIVGLASGHAISTLYLDANGYLFLAWIFPVLIAIQTREDLYQWIAIIAAGFCLLTLKTVLFLFAFTHPGLFGEGINALYTWIRRTGVGEVTLFPSGFPRVFLQSHLYAVLMLIPSLLWFRQGALSRIRARDFRRFMSIVFIVLGVIAAATILLSYSRSFWLATLASIGVVGLYGGVQKMSIMQHLKNALQYILITGGIGILGYLLVLAIVFLPVPGARDISGDILSQRTDQFASDAAAASRWQQLPPLREAIEAQPAFGYGLGKTVTYISNDPRVRQQSPDGQYTTYAFEWGYLDQLLKFGLLGTALFGAIVIGVLVDAWKMRFRFPFLASSVLISLIALSAVHAVTPYWNHPLGLGWFVFCLGAIAVMKQTKSIGGSTGE